jgi:hypothetical protein
VTPTKTYAIVLSELSPTMPIDWAMSASLNISLKSSLVYWAESTGRRNTLMKEVASGDEEERAEGDLGDAGQAALARASTGLAT